MFPEMEALLLRHQFVRDGARRRPGHSPIPAGPIVARTASSAGAVGMTPV